MLQLAPTRPAGMSSGEVPMTLAQSTPRGKAVGISKANSKPCGLFLVGTEEEKEPSLCLIVKHHKEIKKKRRGEGGRQGDEGERTGSLPWEQ